MKNIVLAFQNIIKPYIDTGDRSAKRAVEANIAPVETDATSASKDYVVGEKLILNDVLYDVTATITAGDALIVDTNISPADDVTSQIADVVGNMATLQTAVNGKASKDVIDTEYEEIGSAALYSHTSGTRFYATDGKIYKASADIAVGDTITVNTNCTLDNIIDALNDTTSELSSLNGAFTNNVNVNGSKNKLCLDLERLISDNTGGTWNNNKYTYRDGEFTVNEDSITFGGTPTNVTGIYIMLTNVEVPPEKYVLSGLVNCTNIMWGTVTLLKDDVSVQTFSINSKDNTEIDCSSYTYDTVRVEIKRTANNVAMSGTANVMLCLKSDWDLDNTFAPYSKSNLQLTEDSVTWKEQAELGAVNHLENKGTTQVDATTGLTFTVNDDKSVTISATSGTYPHTVPSAKAFIFNSDSCDNLKDGKVYRLSGCPSGGGSSSYYIAFYQSGVVDKSDQGDGYVFAKTASMTSVLTQISIKANAVLSSAITFYPMIAPVEYNGPYVPYAKTNKELTDDVNHNLQSTSSVLTVNDTKVFNIDTTKTLFGFTFSRFGCSMSWVGPINRLSSYNDPDNAQIAKGSDTSFNEQSVFFSAVYDSNAKTITLKILQLSSYFSSGVQADFWQI